LVFDTLTQEQVLELLGSDRPARPDLLPNDEEDERLPAFAT
jgi:hypothetical protein